MTKKERAAEELALYKRLQTIPSGRLKEQALWQQKEIKRYIEESERWWTNAFAETYKHLDEEATFQIEEGDKAETEDQKRKFYARAVLKARLAADVFSRDGTGPTVPEIIFETANDVKEAAKETVKEVAKGARKAAKEIRKTSDSVFWLVLALGGLYLLTRKKGG